MFLHNRFSFDREQTFHSFIRFAPTNVVCCCLDYRTIFADRPPNNTTASSCLTLSFASGWFVALFAALLLQEDAIPKNTENPTIHLARECRTRSIFVHFVVHTINGASVFVVKAGAFLNCAAYVIYLARTLAISYALSETDQNPRFVFSSILNVCFSFAF